MDGLSLTNADIKFTFDGTDYNVKKANLGQVILFQRKVKEISAEADAGGDARIAAYAIFLVLNATDKNITEESVLEKCPGDIDLLNIISQLGFMSQQKMSEAQGIRNALVK